MAPQHVIMRSQYVICHCLTRVLPSNADVHVVTWSIGLFASDRHETSGKFC